jgi:hypothetical protein
MDLKDIVETVQVKDHRYFIVKHPGAPSNTSYTVYRDDMRYCGSFSTLRSAVEGAHSEQ